MLASEKGFSRLMDAVKILDEIQPSDASTVNIPEWLDKAYSALVDDFNSPILISHLFEAVKWIFLLKDGKETITANDLALLKEKLNAFVFDVLGLQTITEETGSDKLDETLQLLIELRNQARKTKNWELSDQIRDRLLEKGIELKDGREGTSYTIN
jgi:cysteinyl-tRNA synthetase